MKILTECNLAQLVVDILAGQTVVFPTETSYGLGCDATNQESVNKIFLIKGRPSDKPLLVVVPNIEMAKKYVVWNDTLEKIAQNYWPGALTVVGSYQLPATSYHTLARGVVSKDNTVAIRVTANPLLQSITEKMGRPLVATSANISNAGDLYSSAAAIEMFKDCGVQPDIILNFGELTKNPPSTIVGIVDGKAAILRQGSVKISI